MIRLCIFTNCLWQGIHIPSSNFAQVFQTGQLPPESLIIPFLYFLFAPFFLRKKYLLGLDKFRLYFDKKCGQGCTEEFIMNLGPIKLAIAGILTLGISGLLSTFFTTRAMSSFILSGFYLSSGLGLLLGCLLSKKFLHRLS